MNTKKRMKVTMRKAMVRWDTTDIDEINMILT